MIIVNKTIQWIKIHQEENKPFTTQTFIYINNYRFALLERRSVWNVELRLCCLICFLSLPHDRKQEKWKNDDKASGSPCDYQFLFKGRKPARISSQLVNEPFFCLLLSQPANWIINFFLNLNLARSKSTKETFRTSSQWSFNLAKWDHKEIEGKAFWENSHRALFSLLARSSDNFSTSSQQHQQPARRWRRRRKEV